MQLAFTVAAPAVRLAGNHRPTASRFTRHRHVLTASAKSSARLPTMNDVQSVAEGQGYRLERYAAGPVCRLHIYRGDDLYAFITAVILPTGWLHIESYKARPKEEGGLLSVTAGMLVFMFALAFGASKGCKEVYGLAIRDNKEQHQRLKKYLKRFGGEEVKKITQSVYSIPDKMLYGGVGMIMKGDIQQMLSRSGRMLSRVKRRPDNEVGYTVTRWPEGMKPPPPGVEV